MTPPVAHSATTDDGQDAAALAHLIAADARLAEVIAHIGPFRPQRTAGPFIALVGSIAHQQVSMSAGAAILRRIRALCPRRRLTPPAVLALSAEQLRGAGLSRQKAAYVANVAEFFATRRLTPQKLRRLSDEEVITAVTAIKGVGRWTAEMLLIFSLARPDVWPVDDLGLRKGVQKLLNLDELPATEMLTALAEPWRPYRSYATWYLWKSLENPVPPGVAT